MQITRTSKTKKPYADNSIAADHYHHWKEDVQLMAECGFTSYRFSLAWPRIIPASEGKVNPEGIQFYNDLIDELLAHNITPIVTLYHYDMPVWVDELGKLTDAVNGMNTNIKLTIQQLENTNKSLEIVTAQNKKRPPLTEM